MAAVLSIASWERFQHYKDRDPPWVKLYRDMLTSESWVLGTDSSRLVQVASILLAARYGNQIPLRFDLIKRVANLEMDERKFRQAIEHLAATKFLEIHEVPEAQEAVAQVASTLLAKCSSETEQSRDRAEQSRAEQKVPSEPVGHPPDDGPVERVFAHWRTTHNHPRASLDAKRRRLIQQALKSYSEADLCESISGYLKSPHHMGQNERSMVYDDIELFLRDSKHIDAGLRHARTPQATPLSSLTRRNVDATADWVPPEMRSATN